MASLAHEIKSIFNFLKRFDIKLYILEIIQSILKSIIDTDIVPYSSLETLEKKQELPRIFNKETNGDNMTDREKLMRIEEALHKMRDNYRKIRSNKTGALQMYTNKDVGELVCKDLEKLFKYMEELEVS